MSYARHSTRFSAQVTGYDELDKRIAKTKAKKEELLHGAQASGNTVA